MRPVVNIDKTWSGTATQAGDAILEHADGLYRFALRLTRNADDAQELVQETCLRAWQSKEAISVNVRAWTFQTPTEPSERLEMVHCRPHSSDPYTSIITRDL